MPEYLVNSIRKRAVGPLEIEDIGVIKNRSKQLTLVCTIYKVPSWDYEYVASFGLRCLILDTHELCVSRLCSKKAMRHFSRSMKS